MGITATGVGNCKSVLLKATVNILRLWQFFLTLLSYLSTLLILLVMGGNITSKNGGLTDRSDGSIVLSQLRSLDLCFQKNHLLNGVLQLLIFIGCFFRYWKLCKMHWWFYFTRVVSIGTAKECVQRYHTLSHPRFDAGENIVFGAQSTHLVHTDFFLGVIWVLI